MSRPTDDAIRKALVSHELAKQWLADLERDTPVDRSWKVTSRHESELARARREVALGALALRGARMRALNERLENLRRPSGAEIAEPQPLTLFDR